MQLWAYYAMLALLIGALSGLAGIGGGILLIPALVMFCGFARHQAVRTTLAVMLPPVTLGAAIEYYRPGFIDIRVVLVLTIAVFLGSWATARFAHQVPEVWLKRLFGLVPLFVVFLLLSAVGAAENGVLTRSPGISP